MNCNRSLLSRECSCWIKGLLTLFIILGHDMMFTIPLNRYGAMSFLYLFHIQGFFILPFLYGISAKPYTAHRAADTLVRFYWPYGLLVTMMMLGVGLLSSRGASMMPAGLAGLYLFCDSASIRQLCGVQIFWFLPSMLVMVLLRELYYRTNRYVRFLLLAASVGMMVASVYANTSWQASAAVSGVTRHLPLGMGYALRMLAMGVVLRAWMERVEESGGYRKALMLSAGGFLVCSLLYAKDVALVIGQSDMNVMFAILQNVTPVLFMVMTVSALNILKPDLTGSVVRKLGDRSLYVYLISPFVGYAAYFACNHFHAMYWWVGLLLWPVISCVAYGVSWLITGKLEKFLFPRNWETWVQLFKKS